MFTLQTQKSFANLIIEKAPPLIPPSEIFAIMSIDPFQLKRLFIMRVVSKGNRSHSLRLFIKSFTVPRLKRMTSLFRPWTEQNTVTSAVEGITKLFPDAASRVEDPSSRETRYKSVKEHMKKRSEKYLLKKLRVSQEYPKGADLGLIPPVPFCCSIPDGYVNFECVRSPGLTLPGPDLLETALNQGFPPTLFEEYARFLTEQQKQVADKNRKQRPKKFRCPHCQVGFSNNGQLKGHIRIHTGERPFKCDAESCGKSFTRNEELTRHRRIHSGLRPFPCTECGKRFGRKDHLKKHIKTHFQQRYQLVPILPSHYPYFYGL